MRSPLFDWSRSEWEHHAGHAAALLSAGVNVFDIDLVMSCRIDLFEKLASQWEGGLPSAVRSKWFSFVPRLLPSMRILFEEMDKVATAQLRRIRERHPNSAWILDADVSKLSPGDLSLLRRWQQNARRTLRRHCRSHPQAVKLTLEYLVAFYSQGFGDDGNAVNLATDDFIRLSNECWRRLPGAAKSLFFDLLAESLSFLGSLASREEAAQVN